MHWPIWYYEIYINRLYVFQLEMRVDGALMGMTRHGKKTLQITEKPLPESVQNIIYKNLSYRQVRMRNSI